MLTGLGSCYNGLGVSAEMMVIQYAWLECLKFFEKGIDTELLEKGAESIKKTGPGGNFIIDDLTIELLRSNEFFHSELFDYSGGYEEGMSLVEKAYNKVEDMVAKFESPVPENIREELGQYFKTKF